MVSELSFKFYKCPLLFNKVHTVWTKMRHYWPNDDDAADILKND